MQFANVNLSEIKSGSAFIAETTHNTYVVLAEFRGAVQIVFESFKLSECVTYSNSEHLSLTNGFNQESTDFLKFCDLIPFGHLDEVTDISENVYTWRVGAWGKFEVQTRSYNVTFSDGQRRLVADTDTIPVSVMNHFNGVEPWKKLRKSRKR